MTVVIRFQPGLKPTLKHAQHDQSTHGNWAGNAGEYPEKQWQDAYDKYDEASREYGKKLESLGVPWGVLRSDPVGGYYWQKLVDEGKIKLSKTQTDELKREQESISKLEQTFRQIDKKWYDDHFDSKNKNPNDSFGFDDEIAQIRDEYVAKQIGGVDVAILTNRALRDSGRVSAKAKRFDKLVETSVVKEPVVVWRGAILPQEMVDSMKKGSSFIDKGFQSTGEKSKEAIFYAGQRLQNYEGVPVIFKMRVNKGVNAVDVGYGEIVLQRNTKMKVLDVKSGPDIMVDYDDIKKQPIYADNSVEIEVEVDKA